MRRRAGMGAERPFSRSETMIKNEMEKNCTKRTRSMKSMLLTCSLHEPPVLINVGQKLSK